MKDSQKKKTLHGTSFSSQKQTGWGGQKILTGTRQQELRVMKVLLTIHEGCPSNRKKTHKIMRSRRKKQH